MDLRIYPDLYLGFPNEKRRLSFGKWKPYLYHHKRANEEDIVPMLVDPFDKVLYEKYERTKTQQLQLYDLHACLQLLVACNVRQLLLNLFIDSYFIDNDDIFDHFRIH